MYSTVDVWFYWERYYCYSTNTEGEYPMSACDIANWFISPAFHYEFLSILLPLIIIKTLTLLDGISSINHKTIASYSRFFLFNALS